MGDELPAVSVFGLGKLGAPLAACFAAQGFETAAVDVDAGKVAAMRGGGAPVREPGLEAQLSAGAANLTATTDVAAAVLDTDVSFVVVPTPSEPAGGFSLRFVLPVMAGIGRALRDKEGFHVVVLVSTVMPGSTSGEVRATLEAACGKLCGEGFGLCYNPEFIALGRVIRGMLNPDLVLIGESDPRSGAVLAGVYRRFCENEPPIVRTNPVNAEVTKIALNSYATMKISFANTLAEICERTSGGDVDAVTRALGLDHRIGAACLKGGLGYGGPCFPRDSRAFASMASAVGVEAHLAVASDRVNCRQAERLVQAIEGHRGGDPAERVGVLGLSYRPDTAIIECSQAVEVVEALAGKGVPVIAYDPAAMPEAREALARGVEFAESAAACVAAAGVLVLTTPWDEFRRLPELIRTHEGVRVLIDCWGAIDPADLAGAGVTYCRLGRHYGAQAGRL